MVYMASPGGLQTGRQMLDSFLPEVEISKVTLSYTNLQSGGPGFNQKTLEALYDRNPHLDFEGTEIFPGAITSPQESTTREKRAYVESRGSNALTTGVTLDLEIKVPRGTTAFPSVFTEDSIRQALKFQIKIFGGLNARQNFDKQDPVTTDLLVSFIDFPGVLNEEGGANFQTRTDGKIVEVYFHSIELPMRLIPEPVNNLGIIVYAILDPNNITDFPTSSPRMETIKGLPDSLWVIGDGKISSTTTVYVDTKGEQFKGPVHLMADSPTALAGIKNDMQSRINLLDDQILKYRRELLTVSNFATDGNLTLLTGLFERVTGVPLSGVPISLPHSAYLAMGGTSSTRYTAQDFLRVPRASHAARQTWLRVIHQLVDYMNVVKNNLVREIAWIDSQGQGALAQDLWMKGVNHAAAERMGLEPWEQFLKQSSIKVPKVQDFRIARKIENIPLDFSIIEKDLFPGLKKDLRGNRLLPKFAPDYFSDISLSRDINNQCRFFFSIDWRKIILENSLYGQLIKNAGYPEINVLLNKSRIKKLKIVRKRTAGSSKAETTPYNKVDGFIAFDPLGNTKIFDENEIPTIIAEREDLPVIDGARNLLQFATLRPEPQPSPSLSQFVELDSVGSPTDRSFRHFSGKDISIQDKTDGYYKYEVEIECLDNSIDIITRKRDALLMHVVTLERYYILATQLASRTGGIPPSYSPYIDSSRALGFGPGVAEQEYQPGNIQAGSFDSKTNRFTRQFIDTYWEGNMGFRSAMEMAINNPQDITLPAIVIPGFVQILKFFSSASFDEVAIRAALMDYIDPNSGTPKSIKVVLELMKTVLSRLESLMKVDKTRALFPGETTAPPTAVPAKNRTFRVSYQSFAYFDASVPHNLGYDFLGTTGAGTANARNNSPGFLVLPQSWIIQQSNLEWLKFFNGSPYTDLSLPTAPALEVDGQIVEYTRGIPTDGTARTYYTPHYIVLPDLETGEVIRFDNRAWSPGPQAQKYLQVFSHTLMRSHLPTNEEKMLDIVRAGTQYPAELYDKYRSLFINDLSTYFDDQYNATVVPDVVTDDSFFSGEVSIPILGGAMIEQREQKNKAAMYSVLWDIMQSTTFDSTKPNKIYGFNEMNKWYNMRDIYNLGGLFHAREGTMQHSMAPDGSADPEVVREFLFETPISIKACILALTLGSDALFLNRNFMGLIVSARADLAGVKLIDGAAAFECTSQIINQLEVLIDYNSSQPPADFVSEEVLIAETETTEIRSRRTGVRAAGETNEKMLKSPIWRPYHLAVRAGTLVSGRNYLCRISPYENSTYFIDRDPKYDLPTYDEYFIMVAA